MRFPLLIAAAILISTATARANCGGSFFSFVNGLKAEAVERGFDRRASGRCRGLDARRGGATSIKSKVG